MHNDYTRYLTLCTFTIKPSSKDSAAPNISLKDIIPYLIKITDEGLSIYKCNNGKIVVGISDIKETDNELIILFQFSNKDASNPIFNDPEISHIREVEKENNEGLGLASHLVIQKSEIMGNYPHYKCILEEMPGFSKAYIVKALNSICTVLEDCFSFEKVDNGSNKKYKCYPKFELERNSEVKLEEALVKGHLTQFVAIQYMPTSEIDSKKIKKIENRLIITTEKMGKDNAIKFIKDNHNEYRKEYSKIQISIKNDKDKPKVEDIRSHKDLTLDDVATLPLVEKKMVSLSTQISVCQETIHDELVDKALNILYK